MMLENGRAWWRSGRWPEKLHLFPIDPSHQLLLTEVLGQREMWWDESWRRTLSIVKMARVRSLSALLLLSLALSAQARAPGLYYPPPGEEFHPTQIRSQLEDTSLTPLSEKELETLLYLLDKVQRPSAPRPHAPSYVPHTPSHALYADQRNKRTGAHHLTNFPAAKRASRPTDWSDYFGIDKREVKSASAQDPPKGGPKEARTEAERQAILREFYANMAMSAAVKKKREVRPNLSPDVDQELGRMGDELIADAVKLVGKNRDVKLSGGDLVRLKEQLVDRIGTAYSLEKLREEGAETGL